MKKIYSLLLLMLAAVSAMGQDMPKTEMPVISYSESRHTYSITVQGDGLLDIQVSYVDIESENERVVVETQAEWFYEYEFYRQGPKRWCIVRATAQADGCSPSDVAEEQFYVEPYAFMPVPQIVFVEYDDGLFIDVELDGEGELYASLWINNNEPTNVSQFPIFIPRTNEEQMISIWVTCDDPNDPSVYPSEAFDGFTLAPYELPPDLEQTSAPFFQGQSLENSAYAVTIRPTEPSDIYYRIGVSHNADYQFDFGDWRLYEDMIVSTEEGRYRIEAYAVADGKRPSLEVAYEFVVAKPTPSYIYDFEEDGIFYKITGDGKVSVSSETTDYNSYSGQVTIPATVTHEGVTYMVSGIRENAFRSCAGLTDVTIGAYVTSIGECAFMDCSSLTSVTLGDYVITLGSEAFSGCSSLTSVTLGSGLSQIGANAFYGCDALTSVTCKAATPPAMAASNCFNCYATATLYVHPAVLDSYQAANYWNQFGNIVAEDKVAPANGDTNGDGKLSIADVTSLIEMLLSK